MSSLKRFFGVMSSDDAEKIILLRDSSGLHITIEAGPRGWTVIYADHSVDYDDVEDATENNYLKARKHAESMLGSLVEVRVIKEEKENKE